MKAISRITSGIWGCNRLFALILFLLVLNLFCIAGIAKATEQKLLAPGGAANDYFGNAVEISGNYAIVGAPKSDHATYGVDSGSAYIYHFNGTNWVETQKLMASDAAANKYFGCSVSISGNYAIVGAYGDAGYRGAAYLFYHNGTSWVEQQKVTVATGAVGDQFGYAVAISGNNAVVGAYGYVGYKGAAYIYNFNGTNWSQKTVLLATGGAANDYFGVDVGISGDKVIVSAYQDDDKGSDSGSVFIYHYNGTSWLLKQKLTDVNGAAGDFFGWSVRISGNDAIVGSVMDGNGSAFIYHYNGTTWVQQQKLLPPAGYLDWFGYSVAISDSDAVVGFVGGEGSTTSNSVYAYSFDGLSWGGQRIITASEVTNYFGYVTGVSGDYTIVGAIGDNDNGAWAGAAYIYGPSTLTVSKSGAGIGTVASTAPDTAIDCGLNCSASYPHATSITLIATAADIDSTFTGWSGCDTTSGNTCTVAMNDGRAVIANFIVTPLTAPVVTAVSPTNDTTPTWTWSGGGGGNGNFMYRLDNTLWSAVTTATSFTPTSPLTEASRILYVKEQDAAGNWSVNGYKRVVIDLTPPDTILTANPVNPTNSDTAKFRFTAGGRGNTFQCSLDGGAYAACTTGIKYTGLTEGDHTFSVQASDSVGNQDPTPASYVWTVDRTPPLAPVVGKTTPSADSTPTWIWSSGGGGNGTFRYNLDNNLMKEATVTTATEFTPDTPLSLGHHTLYVQERDAAGNWSSNGRRLLAIEPPL